MSTSQDVGGNKWFEIFTKPLPANLERDWLFRCKLGLFTAPLIFILGCVILKVHGRWYHSLMLREDGPVETLTALAYLIACLIAFSLGRQLYRRARFLYGIMYMVLAIGFLFICLEEISWGQRIFHLPTLEFFQKYNYQKEMNLHNLGNERSGHVLHWSYILIGAYGALTFLIIPKRVTNRFKSSVDLFVPSWFLITYFLPVCLLYIYYELGKPLGWWGLKTAGVTFIVGKDQEPMEFLLSLGFLLFVGINWWRLTSGRFSFTSSIQN
jgi:hypothetical protein